MGKTLDMTINVRHLTDEEAKQIETAVVSAVYSVVPHGPSTSTTLTPDYDGPGRTEEEAAQAAEEGRR